MTFVFGPNRQSLENKMKDPFFSAKRVKKRDFVFPSRGYNGAMKYAFPLAALAFLALASCAADAPLPATAADPSTSASLTSAEAPNPDAAASSAASANPAAPSAAPSTAASARKPFAPDQIFVRVEKGRIKLVQLWQRNEGQKGKETNLAAAAVCESRKQMMGWVVDSGMLNVETDAAATPGALPAGDTSFIFDGEDGKRTGPVEGRIEILSIDKKPTNAGSHAARGKLKVFAKDNAGQLVDGTFDAVVCIDVPSST